MIPRVLIAGIVWHLDVGSSYPRYVARSKGTSVRRLKRYVSWVRTLWNSLVLSTMGVKKFKSSWASMRRMHGFVEH